MRDHRRDDEEGTTMAQEVPRTLMTETIAPKEPARLFRLSPHHVATLRDVAQGVEESDVGLCCSYLVDSMSGEGADFDEHALNRVERYVESALAFDFLGRLFGKAVVSSWRARLLRARRALARLHAEGDHATVAVLMVAFGHPDPLTRQIPELAALKEIGPLVRYTEATERKRQEMVHREAAAYSRRLVVELQAVKERLAYFDRVISSGDALRAATEGFHEPLPVQGPTPHPIHEARKAARKEREEAHKAKRDAFLTEARVEALHMLAAAELRYHAAWLAVAS